MAKPTSLKAAILRVLATLEPGEPLTVTELVEGVTRVGYIYSDAQPELADQKRFTERVLTRLVNEGTLACGTVHNLTVWHLPVAETAPTAEPTTARPEQPVTRPPETEPAGQRWWRTQNGFAAGFTVVVLGGVGLLAWAIMPSAEFEQPPAAPQSVALPPITRSTPTTSAAPLVTTTQPPAPAPVAEDNVETREVRPGEQGVPPDFVPETAFTIPPGDGHGECTVFGGHTPDGQYWEDMYCAETGAP